MIGIQNVTRIEGNAFIGYNKKAGIRVCNNGRAIICKNQIGKNLTQGILLVETATAHIEKNKIFENIKANIAVGGQNSVDTSIIENEILDGRCEGLFLIECCKTYVSRNNITGNHDGIVMLTAVPEVVENLITRNKSNGIFMLKDSRPLLRDNNIIENDGIGLYIRDKSAGDIQNNTVKENQIDLVVERKNDDLANILQTNSVKGDIRIPQNYDNCTLI